MKQQWTPTTRRRATYELAGVASVVAVTFAYALHRFIGLGEMPIVLGTLVLASILGWSQPVVRAAPRRADNRRTGHLTPVVVPVRRGR